jgi:hypothetical protein
MLLMRLSVKALTLPVRWLDKKQGLPARGRLKKLLGTIVSGIKKHGDLASVRHVAVYFLASVQHHIKRRGDEYLVQAKGLQAARRRRGGAHG